MIKSQRTASEVDEWMRQRFSMGWSWQQVFEKLPEFLGVELAPEPTATPALPWWSEMHLTVDANGVTVKTPI